MLVETLKLVDISFLLIYVRMLVCVPCGLALQLGMSFAMASVLWQV